MNGALGANHDSDRKQLIDFLPDGNCMKRSENTSSAPVLTALVILFNVISVPVFAQEQQHPDFSGAWATFRDDGRAVSDPDMEMQLTPAAQKARNDFLVLTEDSDIGAGNSCVGYGMPGSMLRSGGYPMEIIQRPDQLFVLYEAYNEIRRFYLGAEARDPAQFFPERNGYSTAHWEGDHLIVETTRLLTQVDSRYPHSNQATIREEYYLEQAKEDGTRVLVAELTMTDPLWLEVPWVDIKRWQQLPDYHVMTYECTEPLWYDELKQLYDAAGLEMIQE